jgi:hypothetical protein
MTRSPMLSDIYTPLDLILLMDWWFGSSQTLGAMASKNSRRWEEPIEKLAWYYTNLQTYAFMLPNKAQKLWYATQSMVHKKNWYNWACGHGGFLDFQRVQFNLICYIHMRPTNAWKLYHQEMFEQFAGEISQVCTFRVFVQLEIYGTS